MGQLQSYTLHSESTYIELMTIIKQILAGSIPDKLVKVKSLKFENAKRE